MSAKETLTAAGNGIIPQPHPAQINVKTPLENKSNRNQQENTSSNSAKRSRQEMFPIAANFQISPARKSSVVVAATEFPAPEWTEFADWLDGQLDQWGLDAPLYSRCVLSILRQSETEDSAEIDESEEELSFLDRSPASVSARRNNSFGYISAETSLTGNSSAPCLLSSAKGNNALGLDPEKAKESKKVALLECLKSVELDKKLLKSFVDEVWSKFEAVKEKDEFPGRIGTDKQNDSVDSGVCPSPIEEQNYDEAFPPLSDISSDVGDFNNDSTPRAGDISLDENGVPIFPTAENTNSQSTLADEDHVSSTPIVIGQRRIGSGAMSGVGSYGKFLSPSVGYAPFTTEWSSGLASSVKSCPEMLWSLSEFCGGQGSTPGATFDGFIAERPPHFVMPKFISPSCGSIKVGSCPTRLEFCYSGPPASSDLTGWLCAQFASCDNHAKSGQTFVDTNSIKEPTPMYNSVQSTGASNLVGPATAIRGSDGVSGTSTSSGSLSGLLDGQKFFLQVIDEDMSDWQNRYDAAPSTWQNLSSDYDMWAPQRGNYGETGGPLLVGGDTSGSLDASYDFCVPKINGDQNQGTGFCGQTVPRSGSRETGLAKMAQRVPPTERVSPGGRKIVRISDQTHFKPIKSESMEGAYYPSAIGAASETNKSAADRQTGNYATERYGNEEYYVLRQPSPQKFANGEETAQKIAPANERRERKRERAALIGGDTESRGQPGDKKEWWAVGGNSSLPLKFKAKRPEKECQTESETLERMEMAQEDWESVNWMDVDCLSPFSPAQFLPGVMPISPASTFSFTSGDFTPREAELRRASYDTAVTCGGAQERSKVIGAVRHSAGEAMRGAAMRQDLGVREAGERGDRTVFLASGCGVWDKSDRPLTTVEDWGQSHLYEANRAPASVQFDFSTEDHDKSLDEDDLLLKYVSSISLISQLKAQKT